jgi:pimeloyl-ACP methyl ester carboxylesterase
MTHPLFTEDWCAALATSGHHVVGVHFRSHGKSPRGPAVTWAGLLEDAGAGVAYAIERFEGPVVLMGSSQGGILATALAATGDDRLDAVVAHSVLDPARPESIGITRLPEWLGPAKDALVDTVGALASVAPAVPVPIGTYLDPGDVFAEGWSREQFEADPLRLTSYPLSFLAQLLTVDLSGLWDGTVRCPVVVVTGRGDRLFRLDYTTAVYERIAAPAKELVVVDVACHLLFVEAIDQTLPAVLEAMGRALGPGGGDA